MSSFHNSGRDLIDGPGWKNLDFLASKDFHMGTEGRYLQFRFEAFNFPNHPIWGIPNASRLSPGFGTIRSTRVDMRDLQFGLKYVF